MGAVGVSVSGSDTSLPYITTNSENPIQGMVRVWGTDLQVFNGTGWTTLPSSYATVTLDEYALDKLDWVRKKMLEEKVLEALSDDNPAVKIAKENVNRIKQELARAEEQLKITEILSQDEESTS